MQSVQPLVLLLTRPQVITENLASYLNAVGGQEWLDAAGRDEQPSGEQIVEFAGRMCYRSWAAGLNPNVTKVRKDSTEYLQNVIRSGHGSVMEHASYTFVFHQVSRVFTHELIRHRAGVAISEESHRYVRLTDIPVWWPEWAKKDPEVMARTEGLVEQMEEFQLWAADHFGLDDPDTDFHLKKAMTSFMRRFAPGGVSTGIVWSANLRTIRHTIEMRTAEGAEEEIRLVFHEVAKVMSVECPAVFLDYEQVAVAGSDVPAWVPGTRKV